MKFGKNWHRESMIAETSVLVEYLYENLDYKREIDYKWIIASKTIINKLVICIWIRFLFVRGEKYFSIFNIPLKLSFDLSTMYTLLVQITI